MSDALARWKLGAVAVLAAMVAAWLFLADARGQDDKPRKDAPPAKREWRPVKEETTGKKAFFGVGSCSGAGCHGDGSKPNWLPKDKAVCRCDEAKRWKEEDRHGYAYEALTGERGKRMGKLLGYGDDPKTWKACLTCHAVWIDPKDNALKTASFKLEEGVSCVSCHGAYRDWVVKHSNEFDWPEFRKLGRQAKWKEAGMRDLWDPIQRAQLCASCHVGNKDEDKFVTHEMYAAGHPQLPSFELGAYTRGMKAHWEFLREKSPGVAKELGYEKGELEETKGVLVGAAVTLREAMALLIDAELDEGSLDWAHMDCQSCHHDLRSPSWRQDRYAERIAVKGKSRLGRVALRGWSPELVRLSVAALPKDEVAREQKAFDGLVQGLHHAFQAKAYGDVAAVRTAADKLGDFANKLAQKLSHPKRFFAEDARTLLNAYPDVFQTGTRLHDFDGSRQIAWSFRTIRNELAETGGAPAISKPLAAHLEELNKALRLDMTKAAKGDKLEATFKATAEAISAYDPKAHKAALDGLRLTP